jgi:hypothetical protein
LIIDVKREEHLDLSGVDFAGCLMEGVKFESCNLTGVSFRDCDLTGVIFNDCISVKMDLRGAKIKDLQFCELSLSSFVNEGLLQPESQDILLKYQSDNLYSEIYFSVAESIFLEVQYDIHPSLVDNFIVSSGLTKNKYDPAYIKQNSNGTNEIINQYIKLTCTDVEKYLKACKVKQNLSISEFAKNYAQAKEITILPGARIVADFSA